jgi:predicted AAA+ superfamily ATPase
VFTISPWTRRIARAIQKERKIYLWDTPRIKDQAARFENGIALELWRAVTSWTDRGYGRLSLHFIKNKEQEEVDFVIANGNEPFLLVETKISDPQPSPALARFQAMLKVPAVQFTLAGDTYRLHSSGEHRILIAPACQWLSMLP